MSAAAERAKTASTNGAGKTGRPSLPEISVGKMEDAAALVERIFKEKRGLFIEEAASYRELHRKTTDRPLRPEEAAQITAALATTLGDEVVKDPGKAVASVQRSKLRAYDEPDAREVLLAAGLATSPALIDATKQLVALIEMPAVEHEEASENGRLGDALASRARDLRKVSLMDGRARSEAALDHFTSAAGVSSGEAWSLLVRTIGQALTEAVQSPVEPLSSLTGSLEPTGGGDVRSSTEPVTATR